MSSEKPRPLIFLAYANERVDLRRHLRNLSQEIDGIEDALKPAVNAGICEIYKATNATADRIFSTFQDAEFRNRIAVFHYAGHAEENALQLETASGESTMAHAKGLAGFLAQQNGLELVFLNGCFTRGQVEELLQAGVTNVIATSRAIDDHVATDFAIRFYKGLAGDGSIVKALNEAESEALTAHGDRPRALYWSGAKDPEISGFPWKLYPENNPKAISWRLRTAADDPLFGLPPLPHLDLPQSPYLGLERFTRRHALVFFGRGHDIRKLYDGLTAPEGDPIILLYGQSGVGKSSLLDAGLLPRLETDHNVRYRPLNTDLGLLGTLAQMLGGEQRDIAIDQQWHALEQNAPPVVVILDQVEELFTQHNRLLEQELNSFFEALHKLFGDVSQRPTGRLILGFRKEWLAEIEKQCDEHQLSYRSVFLTPMDRSGIIEAVEGPQRTKRLRSKYQLSIDDGLADTIATRLLSDRDSPIAPTLQILLKRLWADATRKSRGAPHFDGDLVDKVARRGTALTDFLNEQFRELKLWKEEVVESGLILDLLAYHVTPEGTAGERSQDELHEQYSHHRDSLSEITGKCKDLFLLTDSRTEEERSDNIRLAHDTLAPLVKQRFDESDRPGQRARRILEDRAGRAETILDEQDLKLVEDGAKGMRARKQTERELVGASRIALNKRRTAKKMLQATGIAVMTIIIVLTGAFGHQWWQAKRNLREAEAERQNAESRELIARAQLIGSGGKKEQTELSLLLALESIRLAASEIAVK